MKNQLKSSLLQASFEGCIRTGRHRVHKDAGSSDHIVLLWTASCQWKSVNQCRRQDVLPPASRCIFTALNERIKDLLETSALFAPSLASLWQTMEKYAVVSCCAFTFPVRRQRASCQKSQPHIYRDPCMESHWFHPSLHFFSVATKEPLSWNGEVERASLRSPPWEASRWSPQLFPGRCAGWRWARVPSGPSPSQRGIQRQDFPRWQLLRLGTNQSSRFTHRALWLPPPPRLSPHCPPGLFFCSKTQTEINPHAESNRITSSACISFKMKTPPGTTMCVSTAGSGKNLAPN